MLPPGVKLENTYLPYQQGPKYTTPNIDESKKVAAKNANKHRAVGFEDEDEQPGESLKKSRAVPACKKEAPAGTGSGSGFGFIKERKAEKSSPKEDTPSPSEKKDPEMLERRVMADYLQPGGARTKMSKEEKQTFLFKVQNLSKPVISKCLADGLYSPDSSVVLKVLNLMEALLETKEKQYKELCDAPIIAKLHDLNQHAAGSVKIVLSRVLQLLGSPAGGVAKPVQKPLAEIPDLEIVASPPKFGLVDLTDVPQPAFPKEKEAKLNAFSFMQPKSQPQAPPQSEKKGDLFAHLKMAGPKTSTTIETAGKPGSSFTFMKKAPEPQPVAQKKQAASGLEGLDLEFVGSGTTSKPLVDLCDMKVIENDAVLSGAFQPSPPANNAFIMPSPPMRQLGPMMIPNLYAGRSVHTGDDKEDEARSKNDDKYFGFVNEDLQ